MKPNELRELGRFQYEPSQRVEWGRMRLCIAVGFSGAISVGAVLWFLKSIGHGYIVLNALGAALGLMLLARWVVVEGHCRCPRIALLIGLLLGLSTFVAFYMAELIEAGGMQMAYRVDLIPHVIWHSWNTDVFKFKKDVGPFEFQFVGNVVVFCLETVLLLGIPAACADMAARQVYSEETQRWARRRVFVAPPEVALGFDRVLWNDQLVEFLPHVQRLHIPNPHKPPPRSALVLSDFENDLTTGYLSVQYVGMFSKVIVDHLRLSPDECYVCRRLFSRP